MCRLFLLTEEIDSLWSVTQWEWHFVYSNVYLLACILHFVRQTMRDIKCRPTLRIPKSNWNGEIWELWVITSTELVDFFSYYSCCPEKAENNCHYCVDIFTFCHKVYWQKWVKKLPLRELKAICKKDLLMLLKACLMFSSCFFFVCLVFLT